MSIFSDLVGQQDSTDPATFQSILSTAFDTLDASLQSTALADRHIQAQNAAMADIQAAANVFTASQQSISDYQQFQYTVYQIASNFDAWVQNGIANGLLDSSRAARGAADVWNTVNQLISDSQRAEFTRYQTTTGPQGNSFLPGTGISNSTLVIGGAILAAVLFSKGKL